MTSVLVVDDDPQILRALKINLAARGYTVLTAPDGTRVIVLDLGLPDLDGTDVITGLRGWTTTPIIVLSARSDSRDKVEALDAGADDYVSKPFGMDELLARLRAAVRRASTHATDNEAVVHAGSLCIDFSAKQVTRDGALVHLTRPSGASSNFSPVTRANSSANGNCLPKSGDLITDPKPTTCVSTSPSYAANSNPTPLTPAI
jgi:two-component system KDP operon response regulator KdpE